MIIFQVSCFFHVLTKTTATATTAARFKIRGKIFQTSFCLNDWLSLVHLLINTNAIPYKQLILSPFPVKNVVFLRKTVKRKKQQHLFVYNRQKFVCSTPYSSACNMSKHVCSCPNNNSNNNSINHNGNVRIINRRSIATRIATICCCCCYFF